MTNTVDIWLVSDSHYFHKNICKYENRPSNHNELMLKTWNSLVKWNDVVIHLGDLVFGNHPEIIGMLNGYITLVRGNHDRQSINWYLSNGIKSICDSFTLDIYGKKLIFSHKPIVNLPKEFDMNIHGHFHSITHHDINNIPNYIKDFRYSLFSIEMEDYKPVKLQEFVERKFRRLPRDK